VGELRKIGLIVFAFSILLLVKSVGAQQLIFYDDFTRDVFDPWSAWGEVNITAVPGVVYFHTNTYGRWDFTASISRNFTPLGDFEYYFRIFPYLDTSICCLIFRTIFNDTRGGSLEFVLDTLNYPPAKIWITYNGTQYNSTLIGTIPISYYMNRWFSVKIIRRGNYVEFTWLNETEDIIASVSYNLPPILIYDVTSVEHLAGSFSRTYFDDATLYGTPPQHISVTKICRETWNQPYGWLACSPENIEIPSNAVNVTSYTAVYMIPYNYIYEGNASCNFTLQACNYALGYTERCGYRQNVCSGVGYITGFSYYGTIFGGQTVKSSGKVTVPEGCIIPANGGAGFNLTVITHVEYDLITLPPTKSASLSVYPDRGNYSTIFYYHLITSNLVKPYNISFYVDGEWKSEIRNIYEDSYTIESGADKIGSYQVYLIVRDSEGTEIRTNSVTVYVGTGGIEPFTLTVIPTQGDAFTSFNFQTSQIRGGVAPYTVEIYHGADIFVGKCEGVPEGGTCSMSKLLPCGYRNAFAIAKDSAGNQMISNYVPVNVTCAPMGETLNVTLTMMPTTGNSQTIFNLTFTIRGGAPPYRVTWLEWGNPLCSDEIYTRSPPFSVTERWKFPAGSRGISLSVRSADGQIAPSNLLTFDVAWAGETNFTSYDCTGTLGAWTQRGAEVPPAPYVPSYEPVVNRTLFTQAGADWMAFFFTPIFFATLMLVGISGFITLAIAKYGGGQFAPAAFIIISMIMIAIYGIYQIYPPWLVIVLIILAGFVFAKFVIGII
jgi:hypothetical protein